MPRTRAKIFLVIFSAFLVLAAPSVGSPFEIDKNSISLQKSFHNKRSVVHISDITTSRASDDKKSLITYQPINHASNSRSNDEKKVIEDEDFGLYEITLEGFRDSGVLLLRSTLSHESCQENSLSLPAWKIDTNVSGEKFRVRINHAKEFTGKSLFLCVFDEDSGNFQHLGEHSSFQVSG